MHSATPRADRLIVGAVRYTSPPTGADLSGRDAGWVHGCELVRVASTAGISGVGARCPRA